MNTNQIKEFFRLSQEVDDIKEEIAYVASAMSLLGMIDGANILITSARRAGNVSMRIRRLCGEISNTLSEESKESLTFALKAALNIEEEEDKDD